MEASCMIHDIILQPGQLCYLCFPKGLDGAENADLRSAALAAGWKRAERIPYDPLRDWKQKRDAAQAGGKKYDEEKPRMALLDPYAMEELSKVLTFGAQKYSAWNWAEGIHYSRLIGAALRHIFAFLRREDTDPESGLPHLAHALCCLMFCLSMTKRRPDLDDRGPV